MSKRKRSLKASFRKLIYFNENLWRINTAKSGIYIDMLKPMLQQLFTMLEHHNKLLVVRFDYHQDHKSKSSKEVSDSLNKLIKRLKRKYKFSRVGYVWVREQEKKKHQHYHLVLILDGNKIQHSFEVLKIAEQIWQDQEMGNTFSIPLNPYYHFTRGDMKMLRQVIWRISYLAKGRGKGYRSPQAKDYSTSRIKAP